MSALLEMSYPAATFNSRWSRAPADAAGALRATSEHDGSAVVVRVSGEMDARNEDAWSKLLSAMATRVIALGPLVVDVGDMRFMGICAYVVLAQQARHCRRRGVCLCLVSEQPIVARIVAVVGLRPLLLSIHPTVQAAISAAAAQLPDPHD